MNWQLKLFSRQLQAARLGVGGKVVEASIVEFCCGQEGYAVDPAALCEGELGGDAAAYWVLRLLKFPLTVTVLLSEEIETIP